MILQSDVVFDTKILEMIENESYCQIYHIIYLI